MTQAIALQHHAAFPDHVCTIFGLLQKQFAGLFVTRIDYVSEREQHQHAGRTVTPLHETIVAFAHIRIANRIVSGLKLLGNYEHDRRLDLYVVLLGAQASCGLSASERGIWSGWSTTNFVKGFTCSSI